MTESSETQFVFSPDRMIAQGRTAEIYPHGDSNVVKLFRSHIPREAALRDADLSSIASARFDGAPRVSGTIEFQGRIGVIMERADGESYLSAIAREPWHTRRIAKKMARLHHRIHSVSAEGIRTQKEHLSYMIEHAADIDETERKTVLESLNTLPDGSVLCHGDFHPDNVIASPRGPVVIDWMTAVRGDPACDVARTVILLRYGSAPAAAPFFIRLIISVCRNVFIRAYLTEYIRVSGISRPRIQDWELPVLAGRLIEMNPPAEQRQLLSAIRRLLRRRGHAPANNR